MASVYQVTLSIVTANGDALENVQHYMLAEAGGFSPFEYARLLITAWNTNNQGSLIAVLPTDANYRMIAGKKVTNGGGPTATALVNVVGSIGSPTSSAAIAADISFFPGGLRNRAGRQYVAPVPQNGILDGVLQAGYITALQTYCANLITNITLGSGAGTAAFGTFSRSTRAFSPSVDYNINTKISALNKRTVPNG